jgi:plasmid stability protein
MRTTLTLDDDVATAVESRRREHGHSFKQEINELLRVGLLTADRKRPVTAGLRMEPWSAGECLVPNVDNVAEILSIVEGDDYR